MTPQQLKNSIFQRAIEGRLVEQRAEEGTAQELLEEIRSEKKRLVKEGKIKKSKPLPTITEEEKPFDIPDGWEWARLSEICWSIVDCPHSTPKYVQYETDFAGIDTNCIDENGNIKQWRYVLQDAYEQRIARLTPECGDIVLTREGSIGRAAILPPNMNICLGQRVMLLRPAKIDVKYLRWFLMSPDTLFRLTIKQKGLGAKHINVSDICKIAVPCPPLHEQKRIVAKIEELLPLIDKYANAYTKLTDFNNRFPEDMKKSLFQYAIQGKLVEQRAEEGTAQDLIKDILAEKKRLIEEEKIKKTKALPPITEEEIPFDIPEGWEWVRLGDLCSKIGSGNTPSGGRNSGVYKTEGVPLLREQNIYNEGLNYKGIVFISQELSDTRQGSKVYAKDLLLNITGGSIGRCAIVPDDFVIGDINQHILIIRLIDSSLRKYIHSCICSPLGQNIINAKAVGARAGFSAEKCKNMIIPLPPVAEQHRIVAKLEELLPFCDKLNK